MNINLPQSIACCLDKLDCAGHPSYIVGGCVRDSLLGQAPADWDLCSAALPEQVAACFRDYKVIPTGIAHGTVTVLVDGIPVEITTFRSDGDYLDHRRPAAVDFTASLREDLARRDFTVNAMAFHPREGIVDCFGGMRDLEMRRLRCVGDAAARFTEDALRILRLFRFSAQLGFSIEPGTLQAVRKCREYLDHIARERICAELSKLLVSPRPGPVLETMCGSGVLQQFLPEFAPCIGFDQHTHYHNRPVDKHIFAAVDASPPVLEVRLTLLLHDIGKPPCFHLDRKGVGHFPGHEARSAEMAKEILARLRLDRRTALRVTQLIALHDRDILPEEIRLRRLLSELGQESLRQLLEVRIADTRAKNPGPAAERLSELLESGDMLDRMLRESPPVRLRDLAVGGAELQAIGYPQGEPLGKALHTLLALVLEDPSRNTREWLLQRAGEIREKLISTDGQPPHDEGR